MVFNINYFRFFVLVAGSEQDECSARNNIINFLRFFHLTIIYKCYTNTRYFVVKQDYCWARPVKEKISVWLSLSGVLSHHIPLLNLSKRMRSVRRRPSCKTPFPFVQQFSLCKCHGSLRRIEVVRDGICRIISPSHSIKKFCRVIRLACTEFTYPPKHKSLRPAWSPHNLIPIAPHLYPDKGDISRNASRNYDLRETYQKWHLWDLIRPHPLKLPTASLRYKS